MKTIVMMARFIDLWISVNLMNYLLLGLYKTEDSHSIEIFIIIMKKKASNYVCCIFSNLLSN